MHACMSTICTTCRRGYRLSRCCISCAYVIIAHTGGDEQVVEGVRNFVDVRIARMQALRERGSDRFAAAIAEKIHVLSKKYKIFSSTFRFSSFLCTFLNDYYLNDYLNFLMNMNEYEVYIISQKYDPARCAMAVVMVCHV